jgi:hypothetical protein
VSAAPNDEVELVATCPGVRLQDSIATQPVVPPRAPLRRAPSVTRSKALGTSGGGSQRDRSPARRRSGAA